MHIFQMFEKYHLRKNIIVLKLNYRLVQLYGNKKNFKTAKILYLVHYMLNYTIIYE